MSGYNVSIKIPELAWNIWVEEAADREAAKEKAIEHVANLLNQGLAERAKIEVEEVA